MQRSARRPAVTLVTVVSASLLLPISLTGSSVAMPGVALEFHNSLASGQWIVNGYDLTFASLMLASGAFADRFGRRRLFAIGAAVFAVCSLLSALAGGIVMLDVARAAAGAGAAAVVTSGSATLAYVFEGPARVRAFGVFGTALGVGMAFGPFIAGALSTDLGWRSVFLVPGLAGAVVVGLTAFLPESSDPTATRVDWAGTATFSGSLASLIAALIEGPQAGWLHPGVVAGYFGFAALLAAFVVVERRQDRPMFDLTLFRRPRFVSLGVAVVALVFAFTPLLVYLPSYLTAVNGETTLHAGVDLMMLTVPTVFFPLIAGYGSRWIPVRHLVTASVGLTAAGVAWLTVLHPGVGNWAVLGPYAVVGTGIGVSFGVMDAAAVSSVDPARAGTAAGMFNTMRLGGEALGIAVVGTLLVSFTRTGLAGRTSAFTGPYARHPAVLANALNQGRLAGPEATVPDARRAAFHQVATSAYTGGLHTALWIMAAFGAVATLLVAVVGARSARQPAAPSGAAERIPPAGDAAEAREVPASA